MVLTRSVIENIGFHLYIKTGRALITRESASLYVIAPSKLFSWLHNLFQNWILQRFLLISLPFPSSNNFFQFSFAFKTKTNKERQSFQQANSRELN